MGFLRLVWKNATRNRRRTLLTTASVTASISLLAVFGAVYRYLQAPLLPPGFHLLLMVAPRTSLLIPLPLRYGERIRALPGVDKVSPINMVDTLYGAHEDLLFAMACEPKIFFEIYPSWKLPREEQQAFVKERMALIAGREVATKYGWKIGDRIHLRSPGYHVSLELVLRGIYSSDEDESLLGFHWEYLNEAQGRPDKPGAFWVRSRSAEEVPRVMQAIDALFRNSEVETRTQPMDQWVLEMLGMVGNVKAILVAISAAVLFAVLLILANTMAMSIRERTAELAILRALGFRTRQVLGLLAAESLAISLTGAALGCLLAVLLLAATSGYKVGGAMPIYIRMDAATALFNLLLALLISLASTLLPAWQAAHVSIAQALRFVG